MSTRTLKTAMLAAAIGSTMLLGACQSQLLSDDRIASNTAGVLGVGNVAVSNRRSTATNTYYDAVTKDGKHYACTINGGGALALGLTNAPTCNPKE
jgi:hypothetical protein